MKNSTALKDLFLLRKDIIYLNFGSFGACPKPIMDDYIRWQYELEEEPVQFITSAGPGYLKTSRAALGKFIGCDGDDLVYTPNPTYAINIITNGIQLNPGDEVLSTNIEYGAMDKTWQYYCNKSGAKYVRQPVPLPILNTEAWIDAFWKGLTKNTKIVFISHITSSTGLILPVHEICAKAKSLGLITIVDGAHVPGHIRLDLHNLQADIYTGACHKWMMTPKGCSFLYVKKEFQDRFDPLIISWGFANATYSSSKFLEYHQMNGTRDFSAYLTVPAAIRFMENHNWPDVSAQCRQTVKDFGPRLSNLLESEPLAPITDTYFGQLYSTQIHTKEPEKLQSVLFQNYKIEIPVMRQDNKCYIRFSVQAYNNNEDFEKLLSALEEIKKTKIYF